MADPASDLRERVAEALAQWCRVHEITEAPCERCELRLNAVLAALAGDPGDLLARMAAAMRDPSCECLTHDGPCIEHLVAAALSVRWEHAAHLAARVGDAERRAEHAESEHQVTQDRLAEARRELAQAREERDLAIAHDRQPYPTAWAHEQATTALEHHRQRADTAEATIERARKVANNSRTSMGTVRGYVYAADVRAALAGGE